jgi:hypothetical protein
MVGATLYEQIAMIALHYINKRAKKSYIVNQMYGRLKIARCSPKAIRWHGAGDRKLFFVAHLLA